MKQPTSFNIRSHVVRSSIAVLTTFGLSCGLAQVSSAASISGFVGSYALSNWTKTSTNPVQPSAVSPQGVKIEHSDSQTDFTIAPSVAAVWKFDWALDGVGQSLSNVAVYLIKNGSALAAPIFSGGMPASGNNYSFDFSNNFTSGDKFGFRVENSVALAQPIAFQINNFSVQQNEPVATPFEFSPTLGLGLIGAWVGYRRWQRRSKI